jgi:hypothetical protein
MVPIVYGQSDRPRRGIIIVHAAGLLGGSILLGSVVGWAGDRVDLARGPGAIVIAVCAFAYALHHLGVIRLWIPSLRWQVPAGWRRSRRPKAVAFAYGIGLGVGLLTQIQSATLYFALIIAAIEHEASIVVMAAYGVARALPLMLLVSGARTADEAFAIDAEILRYENVMATVNAIALFALAAAFVMRAVAGTA